ncbi:type II toxin-antitoxin system RelE/ParE family toxin [Ferruginibacter sp.]|jgi:plasmid stabilization system protein ParE
MGLQIVAKKRFLNSFKKITAYLKSEFGKTAAEDFNKIVLNKLDLIVAQPNIGIVTAVKNTKSVIVGKGHQNKIYYRIENNKLVIINLIDIRKDPKKNPFNKNS